MNPNTKTSYRKITDILSRFKINEPILDIKDINKYKKRSKTIYIRTNANKYFLKINNINITPLKDIELELKILDYLEQNNFNKQKYYVSGFDSKIIQEGDIIYRLINFIENSNDKISKQDFRIMGEKLSEFHTEISPKLNICSKELSKELQFFYNTIITKLSDYESSSLTNLLVQNRNILENKLIKSLEILELIDNPKVLIHGDYHKHNLIKFENKFISLF